MANKRILIINHTNQYWGGEISLEKTIKAFDNTYEITLLSPGGILAKNLEDTLKVYKLHAIKKLNIKNNAFWIFQLTWQIVLSVYEITKIIKRVKPDMIHCFSETAAFYTILPSVIMRKKIICQLHFIIEHNFIKVCLSLIIGKFISNYIVPSKAVKIRMIKIGHKESKLDILRIGVDSKLTFNPSKILYGRFRAKHKIPKNKILFSLIGAIEEIKGQHIFIDAINYLKQNNNIKKDVEFLIIGSARSQNYYTKIRTNITKYKLSDVVKIYDKVSHEIIPFILKDIDVYVFTSCLPDAFPRSIIEAKSMGKIIIASNVGGVKEQIINNKTGLLFKQNDYKTLGCIMFSVINNLEKQKLLGLNARSAVKAKYTSEKFTKNLNMLYTKYIT